MFFMTLFPRRTWKSITVLMLGTLLIGSVSACGASSMATTHKQPTATPIMHAAPARTRWTATAHALGTFTFVVNSARTGITDFDFPFAGFACGGNTVSGDVTVSKPTTWPITMGQFTADLGSIMPFADITITGAFDASGTWNIASNGTICTGSWHSVP
jgi:hypothetical protein